MASNKTYATATGQAPSRAAAGKWSSIAKITHPKVSGTFPRTRLFRVLDSCLKSPVTWVSAPGGSGKTTLVASYLYERKLNSIWYRIDEGDGDIATFFYYMGLAAKKAAPHVKGFLPVLTPDYLEGVPAFTMRYFGELYGRLEPPFVIVLDNYQHIRDCRQINEIVAKGLDVVPEGINIVIISREEPPPQFARLRAGGGISFLGGDEILFTVDESQKMLRLKGFRDLNENLIHRVHERTRGWAAGLVLIMERGRRKGFDERILSGSPTDEVFDYFVIEIFEKIDDETRRFLLQTSFLPEMTISLAESATGVVRSGEILNQLQENLFFTEKNTAPDPVYRYHPLFREFLLSMAKRIFTHDEITKMKRMVAALLVETGRMEDAAVLLLETADWEGFIPFIIGYAPKLVAQGRTKTLAEWLAAVPAEIAESSPWLLYWTGQCASIITPAEGRGYLEQAFRLFVEQSADTGALMAWAGVADSFIYDFDCFKPIDRWIDWLDERISRDETFPSPEIEAAVASSMVGVLVWRRPGHPAIRKWIETALYSSQRGGDSAIRLLALRRSLLYQIWMGDKGACLDLLVEINRIVESHSAPPAGLIAAKMIKAHYYAWLGDESDRALQLVEEGFAIAEETGVHVVDSFLAIQGAFSALNRGEEGEVLRYAQKLEETLQPGRRYIVFYHYILAMRCLLIEKYTEALAHGMKMLELCIESGLPFLEARARTKISQVYFETGDIESAERELAASEEFFREVGSPYFQFTTFLIRAYFFFGRGKESEGQESLRESFRLGQKNGYTYTASMFRPQVWAVLCAKALGAGVEIEYTQQLIRKRRLFPPLPAAEYENWPWPVKIHTLGRFEVLIDGKRLEFSGKAPRRIISLLKSLIANGSKGACEEKLIDILWPDSDGDAAHDSFTVAVHRLRQLLGNEKALILRDGRLILDPKICWVDAHAFEELLIIGETAIPEEAERLTIKSLKLYRGPFLEDSPEPWAISTRERLRGKYLRGVRRSGEELEIAGNYERAAILYEKGLDADPLVEELYRCLMRCRQAAGQTSEAVAVYNRCKNILRSVLGVDPSKGTKELYRALNMHQET
jgi:ATP/maltotriose-dependent transcriptional regulator MalT/DNA-binding SARP family transcriptional activator